MRDPERYGVIAFDEKGGVKEIIEKPIDPPSSFAVTGLYFYDNAVIDIAKQLKPSPRGELEITDINRVYLKEGRLKCQIFERGFAWLDTGTPDAMQQAASYVQTIQHRQGIKVGCVEEIAHQLGLIDDQKLMQLAQSQGSSEYGQYLLSTCLVHN